MSLLSLVIVLAMIGLIVWAVTAMIPMPAGIKNVIIVVAVVCAVVYALTAFGVHLPNPHVPQVH